MLHKLGIEERESGELVLVQVHHEELVRGREVRLLRGELTVEVAHVLAMALEVFYLKKWRERCFSLGAEMRYSGWAASYHIFLACQSGS